MTKEADKRAIEEEEAAKLAERRRKRRGGLRIPSDNVPRATDGEVSAPVPEDPKLAASVAVAFGGSSGPVPAEIVTDPEPSEAFDGERSGEFEESYRDARAQTFDNERSEIDGIPRPTDDEEVSAPELFIDRGDTDEGSSDSDHRPLDDDPAQDPTPGDHGQGDADDQGGNGRSASSHEGPTVGLGALAGDDSVALPGGATSGDSVEIAFDDEEIAQSARHVGSMSGPARAQTVALTEDDLEEVMEEVGSELAEIMAASRAAGRRGSVPADEPAVETAQQSILDGRRTEPMAVVSLPDSLLDAVPASMRDDVSELEHQEEAAAPELDQDAGDSGEIISDDLLEEVDDTAGPAPPPVPDSADAAGINAEANGDASAEAPAPPPAPAKKPPPAPRGQAVRAAAVAVASQGKGRRRRGKPWFEEIFEEDYLRTLPFLTPQATQSEARFVADSLVVDPGAQLLDVGCGYGRHAMELAARGYHVVALDASLPLLLRGADEAQRRGLDINFVHGDMRELTFDSQFDGAYCLFSTFGYFDDETNKKTAQNIARALKPGARLVVEVLNRDYLIADLPSRVWWEGDGCVVLEEVEFNYFSSRIVSNRSVVFDDGRQLEQEISIRAYSLHEFGKLLHAAGFRVLEISGSMVTRGRFFGGHSRDIIVVAERRNSASGNGDGK